MDPLVSLEMWCLLRRVIEGLSILRALMWLFSSMDVLVCLEVRHDTKGLSTLRTLMWKSMNDLMYVDF